MNDVVQDFRLRASVAVSTMRCALLRLTALYASESQRCLLDLSAADPACAPGLASDADRILASLRVLLTRVYCMTCDIHSSSLPMNSPLAAAVPVLQAAEAMELASMLNVATSTLRTVPLVCLAQTSGVLNTDKDPELFPSSNLDNCMIGHSDGPEDLHMRGCRAFLPLTEPFTAQRYGVKEHHLALAAQNRATAFARSIPSLSVDAALVIPRRNVLLVASCVAKLALVKLRCCADDSGLAQRSLEQSSTDALAAAAEIIARAFTHRSPDDDLTLDDTSDVDDDVVYCPLEGAEW